MSALANAFKRAAGVPEKDIANNIPTPFYGRKVIAEAVIKKTQSAAQPAPVRMASDFYRNEHGFVDYGYFEETRFYPECTGCHCPKPPNKGNGTDCDECNSNAIREMAGTCSPGGL